METTTAEDLTTPPSQSAAQTVYPILFAISFSHLLNDTIQALIPSLYPLIKSGLGLTFAQLGLVTFTFQCTASLLQPLVGLYTDRRPLPFSLATGMGLTLIGLLVLSEAHSFRMIIIAAGLVGMGSAIFHPEASRVAHMAAGSSRGLAQSLFQVGGNAGSSLGPLLAALLIVPRGQGNVAWFSVAAFLGIFVLWRVGLWQVHHLRLIRIISNRSRVLPLQRSPARRSSGPWPSSWRSSSQSTSIS
jgi:FSR family fosmidomycin resistance protein-like MFS transporter